MSDYNVGIVSAVVSNVSYNVFWKDKNGVFKWCNQKFAEQIGAESPFDVLGLTDYDCPWTKQEAERFLDDDAEVMGTGQPKLNIHEKQTQRGRGEIFLLTSKFPVHDSDRNITGVYGRYVDQTKKVYLENKLTETELSCFYLYIKGVPVELIGKDLKIDAKNIESCIEKIKFKLDCQTKVQLIEKAKSLELI